MQKIEAEINKLTKKEKEELEEWFLEKLYKINKCKKNYKLNYIPKLKRKQIVWVDFGVNIGQELKNIHPAIVLFSRQNSGTILVVPLTSKHSNSDLLINIGKIQDLQKDMSYCKIDQIKAISRLRIISKYDGIKYYCNYNKEENKYSNPTVTTEQIKMIDKAIEEIKYKSE